MPQNEFVLAIDQGTTSCRAILFDRFGKIASVKQKEFTQIYPKPGWVEHDAKKIWEVQARVVSEAVEEINLSPKQIAGIGITNQRETIVLWNKETGEPIHNAIVWQDRRTAGICQQLKDEGHEDIVREKTGLLLDPYFSGTKIKWILDSTPGARVLASEGKLLCGTIDTWLVWKLTGGKCHITDVTNASRTLLFNIHTLSWDSTLLQLLSVPARILPKVKSCSEVYGEVTELDAIQGVPISGIAGDQHAALFGQLCFEKGMAKNTYGTGCFLLMNTGAKAIPSNNKLLTTLAWKIGDEINYALEGSVFIGGATIQWLRDELELVQSAEECSRLAATVDNSNGAYLVPAFTGLGAPYWDPDARGTLVGVTRGVTRAHICRAALESIAFQSADVLNCMEKDSGVTLKELKIDGGASQSDPLMQFQADLLQKQVARPAIYETTALGVSYLAGLAVGFWKDREALKENAANCTRFSPHKDLASVSLQKEEWQRAVQRSLNWAQ
ncbi:glycerol kinase GlpK [Puniceicoccaceae bacterium K14]|nr:glycerol kinase GlpK [Puniceicoccaceae bacterium K14]